MSSKTTFTATCPLTGETRTRGTSHEYTHALSFKRTKVLEPVEGSFVTVKTSQPPKGYLLVRRTGRACWGSACKVTEIPLDQQKTEIVSLVSFHHSKELALASAGQYEHGGLYRIEPIAVPCFAVVKPVKQEV